MGWGWTRVGRGVWSVANCRDWQKIQIQLQMIELQLLCMLIRQIRAAWQREIFYINQFFESKYSMNSFVVNFKDDRLHVSVSRQPGGESQVDKVVSDSGWSVSVDQISIHSYRILSFSSRKLDCRCCGDETSNMVQVFQFNVTLSFTFKRCSWVWFVGAWSANFQEWRTFLPSSSTRKFRKRGEPTTMNY